MVKIFFFLLFTSWKQINLLILKEMETQINAAIAAVKNLRSSISNIFEVSRYLIDLYV
jgi:hypothetical protein